MRQVTIGDKDIALTGATATQWIYEDEFGSSMLGDYERFMTPGKGESRYYDCIGKMAWAMARTASYPAPFPDYRSWLATVEWDSTADGVAKAVIFEATRALFPSHKALVSGLEEQYDAEHPAAGEQTGPSLPGDGEAHGAESSRDGDADASGLL